MEWEERLRGGMQESKFSSFDVAAALDELGRCRREISWYQHQFEEIRERADAIRNAASRGEE